MGVSTPVQAHSPTHGIVTKQGQCVKEIEGPKQRTNDRQSYEENPGLELTTLVWKARR